MPVKRMKPDEIEHQLFALVEELIRHTPYKGVRKIALMIDTTTGPVSYYYDAALTGSANDESPPS